MPYNQAFVLLTNKHSLPIIELYQELCAATQKLGETYIVYHSSTSQIPEEIRSMQFHAFTNDIFTNLNCTPIAEGLMPGSCHFPLLDFFVKNPLFDYYWFIEDDVRYRGDWKYLFNLYKSSNENDFIACHIRTYNEEPAWYWWDTLYHPQKFIPKNLRIRSFNPFFRISNSALGYIYKAQINNWQGHNEVLFPTLLFLEGYAIGDFGGTGGFVREGNREKVYLDDKSRTDGNLETGTMRYRPPVSQTEMLPGKLYHPVKL